MKNSKIYEILEPYPDFWTHFINTGTGGNDDEDSAEKEQDDSGDGDKEAKNQKNRQTGNKQKSEKKDAQNTENKRNKRLKKQENQKNDEEDEDEKPIEKKAKLQGGFVKISQKGSKTAKNSLRMTKIDPFWPFLTLFDPKWSKSHFLTQKRSKITFFDPKMPSNDRVLPQNTTF